MAYVRNPRDDRAYRARSAALKAETKRRDIPCHICGRPIDTELDWREPMSFTADHVKAIANGGHVMGPLLPAHRSCNARRGTRESVQTIAPPKTSRRW